MRTHHRTTLALTLALALALGACAPRVNALDPREIRTFTSFEAPLDSRPPTSARALAFDHRSGTRGPTLATGSITSNGLLRMQLTAPSPSELRDLGDASDARIGIVRGIVLTNDSGGILDVAHPSSRANYYDDPRPDDRYAFLIYSTRDTIITDQATVNAISGYPHAGPIELALGWNYRLFTIAAAPDNDDSDDARTLRVTSRPGHPAELTWRLDD